MERWDLYTKYREKTGQTCIRGEAIPEGCYHLVVHVWIRNRKGEYLISQRSKSRPTFPLMWECVGGSVLAGETSLMGALRETKEEVGLTLDPSAGKLIFTKIRDRNPKPEAKAFRNILDVWLFSYDGALCHEAALTDETVSSRWMTVSEIRRLYEEQKLVQTLDYFFRALETEEPDSPSLPGKQGKGTADPFTSVIPCKGSDCG